MAWSSPHEGSLRAVVLCALLRSCGTGARRRRTRFGQSGAELRCRGETGAAFGRVLRPWNLKPGEETGSRAVCAVAKGNKPYERLDRGVRFYRLKRGREKKKHKRKQQAESRGDGDAIKAGRRGGREGRDPSVPLCHGRVGPSAGSTRRAEAASGLTAARGAPRVLLGGLRWIPSPALP